MIADRQREHVATIDLSHQKPATGADTDRTSMHVSGRCRLNLRNKPVLFCCSPTPSTDRRTALSCSHWPVWRALSLRPLRAAPPTGGWTRPATGLAMAAVAGSLLFSRLGLDGSHLGLTMLVAAPVLLDFGVTASGVLGQRAI
jgi:hypothetical protein